MSIWRAQSDARAFWAFAGALIALAWAALGIWGSSPYARYLGHSDLAEGGAEAGALAVRVAVFAAAWALMTAAMMLPTSLPLVVVFHTMTRARPRRPLLVGLLVAGYVVAWALFGLAAFAGDLALHQVVAALPWLEERSWLVAAAVLMGAGAYQFTPLKYHCLDKCRSPLNFVTTHWHGRRPKADALVLGLSHGAFCVGCCWSLMLLMFAVGAGSLTWMAALAVAMGVEKNFPWGRAVSPVLGVTLVAAGLAVAGLALAGQPPA